MPGNSSNSIHFSASVLIKFSALDYHKTCNLAVIIVRLFNVAGPRQSGRWGMVFPRFIEQALLLASSAFFYSLGFSVVWQKFL